MTLAEIRARRLKQAIVEIDKQIAHLHNKKRNLRACIREIKLISIWKPREEKFYGRR